MSITLDFTLELLTTIWLATGKDHHSPIDISTMKSGINYSKSLTIDLFSFCSSIEHCLYRKRWSQNNNSKEKGHHSPSDINTMRSCINHAKV